ncbi:hypothetical protein AAEX28_12635 [Lentisphaerota bacterium WC36G]
MNCNSATLTVLEVLKKYTIMTGLQTKNLKKWQFFKFVALNVVA